MTRKLKAIFGRHPAFQAVTCGHWVETMYPASIDELSGLRATIGKIEFYPPVICEAPFREGVGLALFSE